MCWISLAALLLIGLPKVSTAQNPVPIQESWVSVSDYHAELVLEHCAGQAEETEGNARECGTVSIRCGDPELDFMIFEIALVLENSWNSSLADLAPGLPQDGSPQDRYVQVEFRSQSGRTAIAGFDATLSLDSEAGSEPHLNLSGAEVGPLLDLYKSGEHQISMILGGQAFDLSAGQDQSSVLDEFMRGCRKVRDSFAAGE